MSHHGIDRKLVTRLPVGQPSTRVDAIRWSDAGVLSGLRGDGRTGTGECSNARFHIL
jgi:hypothetical protein